ncbi:radical SAM protein [Candidatus Woesearchaeota archaeon]|jgi:MoaA/NifB/PqqE/SkfB family radical SAM enzyme|nr:radical SAM protein [Candidatus Woesearchaeota archaeon]MBT7367868.1 radical SAM protein [Candidatus Woesearchaeota archaeon]
MTLKTEIKIGISCNNNCIFCLNDKNEKIKDKTTDQIKKEIVDSKKVGIQTISFTGGEITIRTDFLKIIEFAKINELDIIIQTNCRSFFYEKFTKELVSKKIELFLISLHAHNEELNKEITSVTKGYEQAVKGIKNLKKFNQKIILNIVINSINAKQIEDIVKHHIELKPDAIQLSWVRPQGKVKETLELIPKYSDNIKYVEKAIEFCEKHKQKISLIGIPLCILKTKYKQHTANPYLNQKIKNKQKWHDAKQIFDSDKKEFMNECKQCDFKKECGGIFKQYLDKYGFEEFKAQKKEQELKKIAEKKLGEKIKIFRKIHTGYTSNNYLVETEKHKYLLKERKISKLIQEFEKKLKNNYSKMKIPFIPTAVNDTFLGQKIEIIEYIEKIDKINTLNDQQIKKIASLLGKIYKTSPETNEEIYPHKTAFLFSQNTNHFSDKEKARIIKLREKLELGMSFAKQSIIHNDLHLGNILFKKKKIIAVIDFEKVRYNYLIYDAARMILSLLDLKTKTNNNYNNIKTFLDEYQKYVPKKEIKLIHPALVFIFIQTLNSLIKLKKGENTEARDSFINIVNKQKTSLVIQNIKKIINDEKLEQIINLN